MAKGAVPDPYLSSPLRAHPPLPNAATSHALPITTTQVPLASALCCP